MGNVGANARAWCKDDTMAEANALPTPPVLRFFISYATEDRALAIALSNALNKLLGDVFAEVWLDTQSLRAGFEFSKQIRDQLDRTDILIIVYTGKEKSSHSFTGLEIGYFLGVMARSPEGVVKRRIVSFYLDQPPPTTADIQGISFGISRDTLSLPDEDYATLVGRIETNHPIVSFFGDMESAVARLRQDAGFGAKNIDTRDRLSCAQQMLTAVFAQLKRSVDDDNTFQKKLVVIAKAEWDWESMELPDDTELVPSGPGVMDIFGQPEVPVTWGQFLRKAPDKFRVFWKDVIEAVITSSMPDRLDIDNSQIIVSESGQHIYRVVLSRSLRYFDKNREFHLYFVEALQPREYGHRLTTRLVRGLELCCRFRFMFLEDESEFSSTNISLISASKLPETARDMLRELNLLNRNSVAIGLNEPYVWRRLVPLALLQETTERYADREKEVREAATEIIRKKHAELADKERLANAITKMEDVVRPLNAEFIRCLADKLGNIEQLAERPAGA